MSLTNPIRIENIVQTYGSYVPQTANTGIVWGTNVLPFPEIPVSTFGGTTAGIPAPTASPLTGQAIVASNIVSTLSNASLNYSVIRRLRARKLMQTDTTPTVQFDETQKAHLATSYRFTSISSSVLSTGNVQSGQNITSSGLTSLMTALQQWYNNTVLADIPLVEVTVCHSSCHSDCHSSRGRR